VVLVVGEVGELDQVGREEAVAVDVDQQVLVALGDDDRCAVAEVGVRGAPADHLLLQALDCLGGGHGDHLPSFGRGGVRRTETSPETEEDE
jgi:hypothetical protein